MKKDSGNEKSDVTVTGVYWAPTGPQQGCAPFSSLSAAGKGGLFPSSGCLSSSTRHLLLRHGADHCADGRESGLLSASKLLESLLRGASQWEEILAVLEMILTEPH